LINKEITSNITQSDFKQIVPQPILTNVQTKISKILRDHPGTSKDKFKSLESSLQFFDLMDYHILISNKAYWPLFEKYFNNKDNLNKHSIQLSNLRNAIRHSREKSDLVIAEGKASIIWFKGALGL